MKAKTLLLIALSSLLIVGCKKSEENNEPTSPEPSFTKITEEQLKSYFPYAVDDKIIFSNEGFSNLTYTVKDCLFNNKAGKMKLAVSMNGRADFSDHDATTIELNAEVTDNKILKIDFLEYLINQPSAKTTGTFTYDASKNDSLPEQIVLSNGAIIKQDKGLVYYEDCYSYKWSFWRRK
jgi:hypothetical protein